MKKMSVSFRSWFVAITLILGIIFCLYIHHEMSKPFPELPNFPDKTEIKPQTFEIREVDYRSPEYVLTAIDLLHLNYYDISLLPPKYELMNIGLGALVRSLGEEGIYKSINLVTPYMTSAEAKEIFKNEFLIVQRSLESRKNNRSNILGIEAVSTILNRFCDSHTFLTKPYPLNGFEMMVDDRLGASLMEIKKDFVYINRVAKNQNAFAADLRRFDRILAVNGRKISDGVSQFYERTKDSYGKVIKLTVLRAGATSTESVWLSRNRFPIGGGELIKVLDKKINYIYLDEFRVTQLHSSKANVPTLFIEGHSLIDNCLSKSKGDGIILDLRSNIGGDVVDLTMIASSFLPGRKLLFTQCFRGDYLPTYSDEGCPYRDAPMVILVDRWTFSAGEVLAQILKEYGRAVVVGEQTSGGVMVSVRFPICTEAPINISIAKLITPQGVNLEGVGVKPDIEIGLTEQDIIDGRDPPLEKAKEVLIELINNQNQ